MRKGIRGNSYEFLLVPFSVVGFVKYELLLVNQLQNSMGLTWRSFGKIADLQDLSLG
jgi:hypothetical protein